MTALRKPVQRKAPALGANHGVAKEIVVTLYPRGTIGLREARRPAETELTIEVGALYTQLVRAKVASEKPVRAGLAQRRAGLRMERGGA